MDKTKFNYNYIIFGGGGYYLYGYHDIIGHPQIDYHKSAYSDKNSKTTNFLIKVLNSHKIPSLAKRILKPAIFPLILRPIFDSKHDICFIFWGLYSSLINLGYIEYLRKKFPSAKFILYMQDIVEKNPGFKFNFREIITKFDFVLSYDKKDASKYDLHYHPTPMSNVEIPDNPNIPKSDVYFCGYAKERHSEIVDIFNRLTSLGLKCDFNIMNLPSNEAKVEGINYPSHNFSYLENLQHVKKTKCILEIMQKNADGYTPRLWESIIYDKHLLSNNKALFQSDFNYPRTIHYLNKDNIDILEWINNKVSYSKETKSSLSPINLIKFIDNLLINQ